jgi:hypothetical protein
MAPSIITWLRRVTLVLADRELEGPSRASP